MAVTPEEPHPFVNTYHNSATPPAPDVPAELADFMMAIEPILAATAELARVVTHSHQGACTQLIGEGWAHARKFFSLSEKYAQWADYASPPTGFGIHAYAHTLHGPLRMTDEELRAHPKWRNFGAELGKHPPMRAWLMVPLTGSDGDNYGLIQASDRIEGDFTEQDEINLVRLGSLTSAALDALACVHLADYRAKLATMTEARKADIPPGEAANDSEGGS